MREGRSRGWLGAWLVLAGSALAGPEARAQAEQASQEEQARQVFELGRRAYEDGRFEEAARYFERSLELSGRAELHYNIGAAYERAGRAREAVAAFERFLEAEPANDRRVEVEERVRVLRASAGYGPGAGGDGDGGGPGVGPFLVLGGGVAAAVAGAVFLGLAASAKSTVEGATEGTPWVDVAGDAANAETFGLVGAILLGVGAAAAAGGLVWLIAGGGSEAEPGATVALTPLGAVVRGAF